MSLSTINGFETYLPMRRKDPEVVTIMMTVRPPKMADLIGEVLNNYACSCLFEPVDMRDTHVGRWDPRLRKQRQREGRHG